MGGGGSAQLTQSGFKVEYDRSGRLGVNSVKSRFVDWILGWQACL